MQSAFCTSPATWSRPSSHSAPSSPCQLRPVVATRSNSERHAARLRLARQRVAARMAAPQQATMVSTEGSAAAGLPLTGTAPGVAAAGSADAMLHVVNVPKTGHGEAVMMQGFGWDSCRKGGWYGHLQEQVDKMAEAGISHLWLPPPSRSVSPEGYMPGQLYDLNSSYGNKEQLQALNQALKSAGISPVADIVVNHRCADEQDEHGRWNCFRDDIPHPGPSLAWGPWAIAGSDDEYGGQGHHDTGADFWGAPDIDHNNHGVREGIVHWLRWLREEVGFESFRFDFAKGFGSHFVGEYIEGSDAHQGLHVGEYWCDLDWSGPDGSLQHNQEGATRALCDWINGCSKRAMAFDFVQKGVLQEAVKRCEYWRLRGADGKPNGLLGWWPKRAVTFIANHDTDSGQGHWPFPNDRVGQGYAYILTHPGVPCVFWEHYFEWGHELQQTIDTLLQARKRNNILSTSDCQILTAEGDLYVAEIGGRLRVKLGPRMDLGSHTPSKEEWSKVVCGKDFCVWERRQ